MVQIRGPESFSDLPYGQAMLADLIVAVDEDTGKTWVVKTRRGVTGPVVPGRTP